MDFITTNKNKKKAMLEISELILLERMAILSLRNYRVRCGPINYN